MKLTAIGLPRAAQIFAQTLSACLISSLFLPIAVSAQAPSATTHKAPATQAPSRAQTPSTGTTTAKIVSPTAAEAEAQALAFRNCTDAEALKAVLEFSRACSYGNTYTALAVDMDAPISDQALRGLPASCLKTRLEKLRKSHKNAASWQNVGISFTLAFFGVDYEKNLHQILRTYEAEQAIIYDGKATVAQQWTVLQRQAGASLFEPLALPQLLIRLYENNQDTRVLRRVLAMRGIGGLAEASAETQTNMLLTKPRAVVDAIANDNRALISLGRFISPMMIRNDYYKVCKLLGDLAVDTQYRQRYSANTLLQTIQSSRTPTPRAASR